MPISRLSATSCVGLEPRPLPSTGVTRFPRYHGPLRYPRRPSLSLAGVWLRGERRFTARVSRVALDLHVPTCRRHYPGGPLGSDRSWDGLFQPFSIHPQRQRPSPSECKVGVHIGRFEACSTFTCVTACRLAASPKRHICLEGSNGFVSSTAAPIATGWSDPVAGWELHPLKSQHLFTAHTRSDPMPPIARIFPRTRLQFTMFPRWRLLHQLASARKKIWCLAARL